MSKEAVTIVALAALAGVAIVESAYRTIRSINRMKLVADKTNYAMAITALQEVRRVNEHSPEVVAECDKKIIELSANLAAL